MTAAQCAALWRAEGGSSAPSVTDPGYTNDQVAGAIAFAESSGNAAAVTLDPPNNTDDLYSYGLWQIHSPNFPGLAAEGIQTGEILAPTTNAQAAIALFNGRGGNFTDWSTYTSGAYKAYLSASASGGTVGTTASAISSGNSPTVLNQVLQSSTNPFTLFTNWTLNSGVNVLYKSLIAAFLLIILACIPQTSKFAGWASLTILVLLLIQQDGQGGTDESAGTISTGTIAGVPYTGAAI